jgi:asparagine synthase (glutamine-hydrolysing)
MPGVSLALRLANPLTDERRSAILRSLDSVLHTGHYAKRVLVETNSYLIASTQYEEYPLRVYEAGDFYIVVEGRVQGKAPQALRAELEELAERVFASTDSAERPIRDWLLDKAGDFVIVFVHRKTNRICLFNDLLGRLPLYYSRVNDEIVFSRELRFIAGLNPGRRFDKMAIAQYLLWGYPLGSRTLFEDAQRLGPGTTVEIQSDPSRFHVGTPYYFNFEEKRHNKRTVHDNAEMLESLFSQACLECIEPDRKTLLGLSGGLDSRSVGACLTKNNVSFSTVTFDIDKVFALDAKLAEQLARVFRADWRMFQLDSPKGKDFARLLRMKGGLNYLGMSFILPFFDRVKAIYGSDITYLTGDGGDKVLPDLRPEKSLRTIDELVAYAVANTGGFSLKKTACLTRLRQDDIVEEIRRHVETYPERSLEQKYIHFLIYERGFKWLFEGEDRNRCYFWSATPFYSLEFFKHAMDCPDEQKANYDLYRHFLLCLSPAAAQVDNSHWSRPLASKSYLMKILWTSFVHQVLSPQMRKKIRSTIAPYRPSASFLQCFQEQVSSCRALDDYLCRDALKTVPRHCTKTEMANLMTITSCIEDVECGRSTLEQYAEAALA